jgi:hypothetical protein
VIQGQIEPGDLTYGEVATYLDVDYDTVSRLACTRQLAAKRVPGKGRYGARRVPQVSLLRMLAQCVVPAVERTAA